MDHAEKSYKALTETTLYNQNPETGSQSRGAKQEEDDAEEGWRAIWYAQILSRESRRV